MRSLSPPSLDLRRAGRRRRPLARLLPALPAFLLLAGCAGAPAEPAGGSEAAPGGSSATAGGSGASGEARTVATGLAVPWGIAFLPDGDALVSERTSGRILRVGADGGPPEVAMEVPGVDVDAGEGGLLGLAVSPDYAWDRLVFAYFTSAQDNRVVAFRLGERTVRPILTGLARSQIHNGGRIAFGPDGMLYAGTGDTGDTELAQSLESPNGKILRLARDGSVPEDNPFSGSPVYSLGHRNVQGLAWDGAGRLWATEFGQNDVDEVNLIRAGANHGWPRVEGEGDTQGGRFTNPLVTWPTSDASPSGAAVAGEALYVAALRGEGLWRVPLDGARAGEPELHLAGRYGRLRTVVRAPDGALWVATSNTDGRATPREGDDGSSGSSRPERRPRRAAAAGAPTRRARSGGAA